MALLDKVEDDILIKLQDMGLTYSEMSNVLGVSAPTICKEFKKRNLDKDTRKLKHITNEQLTKFRQKNMSYEEIGKLLKVSANTVSNEYRLRDINIDIDKSQDRILGKVEDSELIGLRLDGLSYDEIANKYNVSKSLIVKEFRLRNINDNKINRKCKVVNLNDELLIKSRSDGNSYESIAELLEVSTTAVHKEYKARELK